MDTYIKYNCNVYLLKNKSNLLPLQQFSYIYKNMTKASVFHLVSCYLAVLGH